MDFFKYIRIEDILKNSFISELVLYHFYFYLYPHQILEKPRVLLTIFYRT